MDINDKLLTFIIKNISWETIAKKMIRYVKTSTLVNRIYIYKITEEYINILRPYGKYDIYPCIIDKLDKLNEENKYAKNITIHKREHRYVKVINLFDDYYLILCSENKIKTDKNNIHKLFATIIRHLLREKYMLKERDIGIANISHELRTPLNSIIGYLDILLNDMNLGDEEYRISTKIRRNGMILLQLINDIIDVSKIENDKMKIRKEPCSIKKIINESIQISMNGNIRNVELYKEISEDIPQMVLADSTRLRQILVNLISNAFKFTMKGYVKVYAYIKDGRYFSESTNSDDQSNSLIDENVGRGINMEFIVEDTGIGIKQDDMNKLYKTFSQINFPSGQKMKGNGLGLSIVKKLVELMDGAIDVDSKYGKGTRFIFHIPMYEYNSFKENIDYRIINGCEILFISKDYEEEICRIINIFEKYDIKYKCRSSMRLGIQTGIKNSKYRFDAIILTSDISDMDMQEFVDNVKNHEDIPIIYLTHEIDNRIFDRSLHLPCNEEELIHCLYKLTYKKRRKRKSFKNKMSRIRVGRSSRLITNYEANILIVDDNDGNLEMLKDTLPYLGYKNIDIAHNGEEAYDMVKDSIKVKRKNGKYTGVCKYKIIFMDLLMPGISGMEAARKIKKLFTHKVYMPMIVALTANVLKEDYKLCKKYMDGHIRKPFKRRELIKYLSMI